MFQLLANYLTECINIMTKTNKYCLKYVAGGVAGGQTDVRILPSHKRAVKDYGTRTQLTVCIQLSV